MIQHATLPLPLTLQRSATDEGAQSGDACTDVNR